MVRRHDPSWKRRYSSRDHSFFFLLVHTARVHWRKWRVHDNELELHTSRIKCFDNSPRHNTVNKLAFTVAQFVFIFSHSILINSSFFNLKVAIGTNSVANCTQLNANKIQVFVQICDVTYGRVYFPTECDVVTIGLATTKTNGSFAKCGYANLHYRAARQLLWYCRTGRGNFAITALLLR